MTDADIEENAEQLRAALHNHFILSHDSLRNISISQDISVSTGWPDKPPLPNPEKRKELIMMKGGDGVPGYLRCAVLISNICFLSNAQMPSYQADTNATLGKIRAIEHGWDLVTKECFPDSSDALQYQDLYPLFLQKKLTVTEEEDIRKQRDEDFGIRERLPLTKVLLCVDHMLGVKHCPLLPDIVSILLMYMPESCVYQTVREMIEHGGTKFMTSTQLDYYSNCRTFGDLMKRFYPKTAKEMTEIGALSPIGLEPIFNRFFIPILPFRYVMRIMDFFTLEGQTVIFRFGVALLAIYKKQLKSMNLRDTQSWWKQLKDFTHDSKFDFDEVIRIAYGAWGNVHRKRCRFPKQKFLDRRNVRNQKWARSQIELSGQEPIRPIGFISSEESTPFVLAKDSIKRAHIAEWLPRTFQDTKIDCIYSTNVHGRTLERFYTHCAKAKHTLILIEVLDNNSIIGAFATDKWHKSSSVYGDGGCFLFSLHPEARYYPWSPGTIGSTDTDETDALLEQFMMSTSRYISMGGSPDGSCGLRLNEDLTKGSSARSITYNNEPLAGEELREFFEVGVVEVFRFVRAIDGQPLDKIENIWSL